MATISHSTASQPKEKFKASDITGASWGRDFHLVDTASTPRSLVDYRGKVVMFVLRLHELS